MRFVLRWFKKARIAVTDCSQRLDSRNNDPSASGVEDLYSKIREAADRHAMKQYLPANYRVLNESAR